MNNVTPIVAQNNSSDGPDWNALLRIVEDYEQVEADRSEAIEHSQRKANGLIEELEASAYENAQMLNLLKPDGTLDDRSFHDYIVKQGLAAKNALPEYLRREATKRMDAAAEFEEPQFRFATLSEALGVDLPDVQYRIEGLTIERGNVLLAAQYKSGKSTCMFNLIKSLCDGDDFLGFGVTPLDADRRVVYYDFELDESYCINQLKALNIEHPERCVVRSLRGHTVPLTTDRAKEWVIADLKASNADVWIIDPFAAVFTGDENSNTEVNEWLRAVDEIKRKAGVQELILVTHTGRNNEGPTRARGATRLDDWADVRWTWETVKGEDRKSLTAKGRGVSVDEVHVEWNPDTNIYRRIEIAGSDTDLEKRIIDYLMLNPDSSTSTIRKDVTGKSERIAELLNSLENDCILSKRQSGKATFWSVNPLVSR